MYSTIQKATTLLDTGLRLERRQDCSPPFSFLDPFFLEARGLGQFADLSIFLPSCLLDTSSNAPPVRFSSAERT